MLVLIQSMTQKQGIEALVESLVHIEKAISDSMPLSRDIVRNRNDKLTVVDPQAFRNASFRLLRTIDAFRGRAEDLSNLNQRKTLETLAEGQEYLSPNTIRTSDNSIWEKKEKNPHQGNVNDLAEKCWYGATIISNLEDYANQALINRRDKRYVLGKNFFYLTEIGLLKIATAYRGAPKDYADLGIAEAKLSDDRKESKEKTKLADEAIYNLEQAIRLDYNYRPVHHYLGLAYSIRGKNSDWNEKEDNYMNGLKHLNEAQKMGERADTQELIVDIQSEFAEDTIENKTSIDWYKKAVESAKKLVDMEGTSPNYYKLGMLQVDFSEGLYPSIENSIEKDKLKRDGLINLRISYGLEKDQDVLGKIKEIESI